MDPISVAVERGGLVESRHRVHAVAVREGEVVESWGDVALVTFLRSAAKPIQALPLVREHPDLVDTEIAIACASHAARPEQLEAVRALLARAEATEQDLECGTVDGSRLRHNCSGKHAGMLCVCAARGWSQAGYRLLEHPLQQELLAIVAQAAATSAEEIPTGTDGCGVVTFGLPLERMASTFSRLLRGELEGAVRIRDAMAAHPELVEGPGTPATEIMRAVPGAIAKGGAEGVLCAALPDGRGFAIKVEDGAARALAPAAGRLFGISALAEIALKNSRGDGVGRLFVPSENPPGAFSKPL